MTDSQKKNEEFVRISLTPDQAQKVRQTTGKDAEAIELTVSEIEDRIAPRRISL
jgi:hypothetical protein